MRLIAMIFAFMVGACASHEANSADRDTERGHAIAQAHCSTCHAIGLAGESSAPEAPPFRTLSENYRVQTLEEALAEGISVGHPAMPAFAFDPEDVDALIAYLQSIQQAEPAS